MKTHEKLVIWFDDIRLKDIPEVGGKNASLGEMRRNLHSKGVSIPDGYAVTADAYRYLLESAGIQREMKNILSDLDTQDIQNLSERGKKNRSLVYNAGLPEDLRKAIVEAYKKL